jgi:hypothetical protein
MLIISNLQSKDTDWSIGLENRPNYLLPIRKYLRAECMAQAAEHLPRNAPHWQGQTQA